MHTIVPFYHVDCFTLLFIYIILYIKIHNTVISTSTYIIYNFSVLTLLFFLFSLIDFGLTFSKELNSKII